MFMLVGVNKQMEELTLILCKQALHQKGNHPGVLWECKVLMSQMSQWVMSHESRSQVWKKNSVETIKLSVTFTYFV